MRGDWAGKLVDVNLLNGVWWVQGGGGVQGRYGEVGSSVKGMARLRRIASSGWAGGERARAGWVDVLFSARMDGLGPLFVAAEFVRQ